MIMMSIELCMVVRLIIGYTKCVELLISRVATPLMDHTVVWLLYACHW